MQRRPDADRLFGFGSANVRLRDDSSRKKHALMRRCSSCWPLSKPSWRTVGTVRSVRADVSRKVRAAVRCTSRDVCTLFKEQNAEHTAQCDVCSHYRTSMAVASTTNEITVALLSILCPRFLWTLPAHAVRISEDFSPQRVRQVISNVHHRASVAICATHSTKYAR